MQCGSTTVFLGVASSDWQVNKNMAAETWNERQNSFSARILKMCDVSMDISHLPVPRLVKIIFLQWNRCVTNGLSLEAIPTRFVLQFNFVLAHDCFCHYVELYIYTLRKRQAEMRRDPIRSSEASLGVHERLEKIQPYFWLEKSPSRYYGRWCSETLA